MIATKDQALAFLAMRGIAMQSCGQVEFLTSNDIGPVHIDMLGNGGVYVYQFAYSNHDIKTTEDYDTVLDFIAAYEL